MRWFTRRFAEELSDDEWAAIVKVYQEHLAVLVPSIPSALRRLAEFSLHDARFKRVMIDRTTHSVMMNLIGGDLQRGYSELLVRFVSAATLGVSEDELRLIVENPKTEVLYDELERTEDGMFDFRLLVWPDGELGIRFVDAAVEITPCSSDEYQTTQGVFEERQRQSTSVHNRRHDKGDPNGRPVA